MNKNLFISLLILVSALLVVSCGKKKPDPSEYAAFCAETAKCDKKFQAMPNSAELCTKFMAAAKAKVGDKISEIESCAKAQSCAEKDLMQCIQKHVGTLMAPQ